MKLSKIFAVSAAAAVAVSTMAVSSFAALDTTDYLKDGVVFLKGDEAKGEKSWAVDAGVAITDVYGVTFHVKFNADEIANEETWIGGGVGANSESTGWKSTEWGRNEKPITPDFKAGTITWLSETPVFTDTDTYCQLWMQTWGGTVEVVSVDILGKDGTALNKDADIGDSTGSVDEPTSDVVPGDCTGDINQGDDNSGDTNVPTGVTLAVVPAALAAASLVAAGVVVKKRK